MLTSPGRQQSSRVATAVATAVLVVAPVFTTAAAQTGVEGSTVDSEAVNPEAVNAKGAETSRLVGLWLRLWNGDYRGAERFIRPDLRVHAALTDGGDGSRIRGPEGLVGWVRESRAAVPDLVFTVEVGPVVEGDLLALRWRAEGSYAGGVPGATAPAGTPVSFTGTDILRLQGGRIAEYWINSDTLDLLTQLGLVGGGN